MPEIQIRPATPADLPRLLALDHDYMSNHVWQMDIRQEENQVSVVFRQIQLPRSVRVEYPRNSATLEEEWKNCTGLLAAFLEESLVGYISLRDNLAPLTTWVMDLAVMRRVRRQGIGSALVLAAQEWARQHGNHRCVLEMQPKNFPAICMAQKLGFDLCGYNDRYYKNHDIALFFSKAVR
jgi:ribosomal protein S18 acetylase RimI-like enzyme